VWNEENLTRNFVLRCAGRDWGRTVQGVILNEVKDFSETLWNALIPLACRELRARGPSLRSG